MCKFPMFRPTMRVYARRFGGFPLTAEAWEAERKQLETDLVGKPHHDTEYYTVGYNSPHIQTNRYQTPDNRH